MTARQGSVGPFSRHHVISVGPQRKAREPLPGAWSNPWTVEAIAKRQEQARALAAAYALVGRPLRAAEVQQCGSVTPFVTEWGELAMGVGPAGEPNWPCQRRHHCGSRDCAGCGREWSARNVKAVLDRLDVLEDDDRRADLLVGLGERIARVEATIVDLKQQLPAVDDVVDGDATIIARTQRQLGIPGDGPHPEASTLRLRPGAKLLDGAGSPRERHHLVVDVDLPPLGPSVPHESTVIVRKNLKSAKLSRSTLTRQATATEKFRARDAKFLTLTQAPIPFEPATTSTAEAMAEPLNQSIDALSARIRKLTLSSLWQREASAWVMKLEYELSTPETRYAAEQRHRASAARLRAEGDDDAADHAENRADELAERSDDRRWWWHVHAHGVVWCPFWPHADLLALWRDTVDSGDGYVWIETFRKGVRSGLREVLKYACKPLSFLGHTTQLVGATLLATHRRRLFRMGGALRGVALVDEADAEHADEGTLGDEHKDLIEAGFVAVTATGVFLQEHQLIPSPTDWARELARVAMHDAHERHQQKLAAYRNRQDE